MEKLIFPLIAGLGATATISILVWINTMDEDCMWVIAPFGATTVLVFGAPYNPMAQPKNVILGHLLTAFIGLVTLKFFGVTPTSLAVSVGISLAAMLITQTMHPPAGGNPLIIMLTGQDWQFMITPILIGVCVIVLFGRIVRWCREKYRYV
ncbi:HPP family protein [Vibrio mangrovi]|uniref:HPP family protein n=1 Tax=Vibrio mangrovi TaxID=474394 RepID=A0A1Y6IR69_9VIBR|nr:HPP family protein [Vibrio mangrovi]MDW6001838.1 HPP family protein [Vibrio mangrovi]SMS00135.1 HPP family protein [Vibrio mangrovi]